MMKHHQAKDIQYKKIAWTINDFSTDTVHLSEVFTVGHRAWQVLIYRGIMEATSLSIYLLVADASSLPQGWSIDAEFSFTVVNQFFRGNSVQKGLKFKFWANAANLGFPSFMPLNTLQYPSSGYILNDKCIVEVEFFVIRSEGIVTAAKDDDVVDFKDLGQIEKAFVPLLDEVCSWHPSLLECEKNRSRRFTEWAFTAWGRVLQFLKNKKWKDMDEEACEQLQYLWDELEISRLELSWLEPHVKSALNMKGYSEKAEKVKKLKENLLLLEKEMKMLNEKLVDTEQSVEMIRKDLANVEEGFEEKDLDAKIGYGTLVT